MRCRGLRTYLQPLFRRAGSSLLPENIEMEMQSLERSLKRNQKRRTYRQLLEEEEGEEEDEEEEEVEEVGGGGDDVDGSSDDKGAPEGRGDEELGLERQGPVPG